MKKAVGTIAGISDGKRLVLSFEIKTKNGKTVELISAVFDYTLKQISRFDSIAKVIFKILPEGGA